MKSNVCSIYIYLHFIFNLFQKMVRLSMIDVPRKGGLSLCWKSHTHQMLVPFLMDPIWHRGQSSNGQKCLWTSSKVFTLKELTFTCTHILKSCIFTAMSPTFREFKGSLRKDNQNNTVRLSILYL